MSESDFRSDDARAEADQAAAADESVTGADPGPIDEEAMAAADGLTVDPDVRENYQEQMERSANLEGEGRIP
ncbi:MAG TPA: hypothetical protein VNA20_01690 [Frankiaceae bacterium]|nr:hypothetical protein [Frankiaceae bacterium]